MMEPIQKKKKTTVAALNTRALLLMMSSIDSLLVESLAAFVKEGVKFEEVAKSGLGAE